MSSTTARDWIVRGRIPPDAARQIRAAIQREREDEDVPKRFIFKDWDALDPIVFRKRDRAFKAFVDVYPDADETTE
jgi:hypothetical protein